jgi:predicted PurR-regulated permease PerM
MQRQTISNIVLITLVLLISLLFFTMIRNFLTSVLMAAIFSALSLPIHRKIARLLGGRPRLAALTTLLLFCVGFLLPLLSLVGILTAQAVKVAQTITRWVQYQIDQPVPFSQYFQLVPFLEELTPFRDEILRRFGDLASRISLFLINSLSAGALTTVTLIFLFFLFLYSSYFFLIDGQRMLDRIMLYLPLEESRKRRLLERFTSVTRATLKGTLVIGVLQGGLGGVAFAVVGIEAAVFWGTIMTILSIIPPFGIIMVWLPAAIILAIGGEYLKAIGLALFCGLIVGSLDNLLRPRLIGKDTRMHDLLILFSTLGGITLYGPVGFILGPIIAALFVTVWELYAETFRNILPESPPPGPVDGGNSKDDRTMSE